MAIMISSHTSSNFYHTEVKIQEVKSSAGAGGLYASASANGGKCCQIYWRVVGEQEPGLAQEILYRMERKRTSYVREQALANKTF